MSEYAYNLIAHIIRMPETCLWSSCKETPDHRLYLCDNTVITLITLYVYTE